MKVSKFYDYKENTFTRILSYNEYETSFRLGNSYNYFMNVFQMYSIKMSKITPVVCPGTLHTNPLMTIGSHPTNTMGPRLQVLGLVEGSQVQKLGVDRQQVLYIPSILQ